VLRSFLPTGGAAKVIVSSSRRAAGSPDAPVPVDVFGEAEALAFLAKRTGLADAAGAGGSGRPGAAAAGAGAQAAALIAREWLDYRTYLGRLRPLPVAGYLRRADGEQPVPTGRGGHAVAAATASRIANSICPPRAPQSSRSRPRWSVPTQGVSAGVEFLADGFGRVSRRRLRPAPAGHEQGDDEGDDQEYGGAGERSRHAVGQDLGRLALGIESGRRAG
jgi:hypothetical protein